jgi:integrase
VTVHFRIAARKSWVDNWSFKMPLSDSQIRALRPRAKAYKKADQRGLFIEVHPTGSKLWRWKYRFNGSDKRIALGRYPDVSIAAARRLQEDARRQLEAGRDPLQERKREKLVASIAAHNAFGDIAREYIEIRIIGQQRAKSTIDKARWLLDQLKPLWPLAVAGIKPVEVLGVLRLIEARGNHETARRCNSFASRIFRYAAATGRAEHDPASILRFSLIAPQVTPHAALTESEAIGSLLRAIDEYSASPITRLAMQILPHLLCRPGQLRQAEWSEFDLSRARWSVPPRGREMLVPYVLPLSRQVLSYLRELRELTDPKGFVFPAWSASRRPMNENTINQAYRRMGYGSKEVTAYGWRRTAVTILEKAGHWSPGAIDHSLGRAAAGSVGGSCNLATYWSQRVEMHQWWSDHLDKLRTGARGQSVSAMRRRLSGSRQGKACLCGTTFGDQGPMGNSQGAFASGRGALQDEAP